MATCRGLSSITLDKCATNRGGILTVWIVDRDDATITIEKDSTTGQNTGYVNIALDTGVDWKVFQFRKGSSSYNSELTVDDANGIAYMTSTLELVFARQEVAKRQAVQSAISNPNLLVVVKDGNKEYTVMGVDESASVTGGGANTGQAASDANSYNITITSIESELPYFLKDTDWPDAE